MKIYDESLYCQECNCEISVAQSKFCDNYCDDCYEQDMQQLDTAVDLDGLDAQGQEAWDELQKPEAIEPLCEGCHRTEEMCICGGVPDETVPGWPPSAQETVRYQEVMARPDEF
jgi:hypothetical protein